MAGGAAAVLRGVDTASYIAKTYQWILDNPGVFRDADIFTPISEPTDAGIAPWVAGPTWQFANPAEYDAWLQQITIACQVAFQRIGKRCLSGCMRRDPRPGPIPLSRKRRGFWALHRVRTFTSRPRNRW